MCFRGHLGTKKHFLRKNLYGSSLLSTQVKTWFDRNFWSWYDFQTLNSTKFNLMENDYLWKSTCIQYTHINHIIIDKTHLVSYFSVTYADPTSSFPFIGAFFGLRSWSLSNSERARSRPHFCIALVSAHMLKMSAHLFQVGWANAARWALFGIFWTSEVIMSDLDTGLLKVPSHESYTQRRGPACFHREEVRHSPPL